MIYLAESGSTKTDAVLLDDTGNEVLRFHHKGLNPYFYTSEMIHAELDRVPEIVEYAPKVTQVFFYAAGSSSPPLAQRLQDGLSKVFGNAEVHVDHDLVACAYATYNGEPGISCILGTGSNSVFFDGTSLKPGKSGLGFILGDEGSAGHIGKKLVRGFFYEKMPKNLREDFENDYSLKRDEVISNVYQSSHANVYLANFAPFASKHIEDPYIWKIVFSGFKEFIENNVLHFKESETAPIHFVGSIAWHFQDILREVLDLMNLRCGNIVQKPLDSLINYHQKYIFNQN